MKSLKYELGEKLEPILANVPGYSNGNDFLFYIEHENGTTKCERKDKFVEVFIESNSGCITLVLLIDTVQSAQDGSPFTFEMNRNGKNVEVPYTEKVTGTIVSVTYWDEDNEPDYLEGSEVLLGKACSAYEVDIGFIEKKEKLDLLYKKSVVTADVPDFEEEDVWGKNMEKIWELGYCGDFIVIEE